MIAFLIFAGTYLVVALGRLPTSRLDRTGAALLGASLMVASGTLSLNEAYSAVNLDTLTLLLGMMIVVANLRFAGFFELAALWVGQHARRPFYLLAGVAGVSALLSAFLVNDTVCLMLTPVVATIARRMGRNAVPYLLAVAMGSNIGSAATITGNPQNIVIGSLSHIPYGQFTAALAPVAAAGLVVAVALLALFYRAELARGGALKPPALAVKWDRGLLIKTLVVIVFLVGFFFWGTAPAKAAIIAGALLLLTRRVKPDRVMREIDWPLLLMFAGLFIVVAGLEKAVLTPELRAAVGHLQLNQPANLAVIAALLGNLVSNVPAVLVIAPFIPDLADPHRAWLVLAMAATFAGNLTILGSVANLIVVENARRARITIGFWDHFRVGAPVTILTIALGVWLLR
ncbi:MAG TPA: anion transporter [Stellaceae bacterium]|nr:anion transporter [Stellaceae bacterium]